MIGCCYGLTRNEKDSTRGSNTDGGDSYEMDTSHGVRENSTGIRLHVDVHGVKTVLVWFMLTFASRVVDVNVRVNGSEMANSGMQDPCHTFRALGVTLGLGHAWFALL